MTSTRSRNLLAGSLVVLLALAGWLPWLNAAHERSPEAQSWESKHSAALSVAGQHEDARKAPKPWPALKAVLPEGSGSPAPSVARAAAPRPLAERAAARAAGLSRARAPPRA